MKPDINLHKSLVNTEQPPRVYGFLQTSLEFKYVVGYEVLHILSRFFVAWNNLKKVFI